MHGKIALLAAAMGFFMVYGCAGLDKVQADLDQYKTKAKVQGNVFSSRSPRLQLKIDNDLKLMADLEEEKSPAKDSIENDRLENTAKCFSYIFGSTDSRDMISRGVIIRMRTVIGNPNQVLDPLPPDPRNELVSGFTKILGDEYHYYAVASENLFTDREQDALSEKNISGCFLVKGLERNTGLGSKSFIQILYFERITAAKGVPQCGGWQNPQGLTDEQQGFLGAFLDRSYEEIRFVKDGEGDDSTARYVDEDKGSNAAVVPSAPEQAPHVKDIEKRLEILKNLLDKNLITQEEYDRKKAEILQEL